MRELAILTFVTLDGVMQAPAEVWEDRSGGFSSAGWARPYWDEVMAQVGSEAMSEPYNLLLGRQTFDNFQRAADEAKEPGPMDAAKKYVVTSRPDTVNWHNSEVISGDVPSAIERLKAQDGPLLQVHGSWQLVQTLHKFGLIDQYRLWTFPVSLGEGKRLFETTGPALLLERAVPTGNGALMTIYRRA